MKQSLRLHKSSVRRELLFWAGKSVKTFICNKQIFTFPAISSHPCTVFMNSLYIHHVPSFTLFYIQHSLLPWQLWPWRLVECTRRLSTVGEKGQRGEMRCRLSGEKERSRKLRKNEWSREGRKGERGGETRRTSWESEEGGRGYRGRWGTNERREWGWDIKGGEVRRRMEDWVTAAQEAEERRERRVYLLFPYSFQWDLLFFCLNNMFKLI